MEKKKKKVAAPARRPAPRPAAAKKRTRPSSAPKISVRVGRFGSDPVQVHCTKTSKVGDVLEQAGINPNSGEQIWLNGERATPQASVSNGDIVSIVQPKSAGRN